MKSHQLRKWANVVALIGIFMFAGAVFFQLQVAFGWNNPAANPPNGNGMMGVSPTGQGWMGGPGTTASGTAMLTVNGSISASKVTDLTAPINGQDAANKAYVDAQGGGGGGGTGGGSLAIYYRTVNGVPQGGPMPTCPSGWTQTLQGYGPHYIAVVAYDWLQGGTGGTGGGFGGTPPYADPPQPPPTFGSSGSGLPGSQSYVVNSVAIGSDSVCSQSQQTVVPAFQFYLNASSGNFFTYSNACNGMTPPLNECNECIICHK